MTNLATRPDQSEKSIGSTDGSRLNHPSSLYRTDVWRLGLRLARVLPGAISRVLGQGLGSLYSATCPRRREVVIQNLLPALNNNRRQAEKSAAELFRQFAIKVTDLWRYESGLPIDHLIQNWTGWEHFQAVRKRGQGILLVTPHLGNWEFGAPLLAKQGIDLTVITQAEPQDGLTDLRQSSRNRWGIKTIVIGTSPFAFIDVIRRLEEGGTVALLIDRPPAGSATTAKLFGKPFSASIAAAELARASGCAVLPVYLPRSANGYSAHILPEVPYDRQKLGKRELRQHFTQDVVHCFEPVIKQHLTQWYHFVPIWPNLQGS